jgi:hypothetical protein
MGQSNVPCREASAYHLNIWAEGIFDQRVNMLAVVDLFHLDFRIDVAMRQEGNVGVLHLGKQREDVRQDKDE